MQEPYLSIKNLTLDLVRIPSMVRTTYERLFGIRLYEILSEQSYFKCNPANLMLLPLENDDLARSCVFAFVEGKGKKNGKTVILLSHYDTVGIEDYGDLTEWALEPERLKEKMKLLPLNKEIKKDLDSDDWLFGRGVMDMKSGLALNIWLLDQFAGNLNTLNGNILFISTPDEEAMSKGSYAAVKKLQELKAERQLEFVGLINTDYSAPRYENDPNKYIYLGSIGKYLLSFFIGGLASHAGQCLEGLDANLIASSLVRRISMNCSFCDEAEGEVTPPPVTLKQRDLKKVYDVQIPYESQVYFNFFTFSKNPEEVLSIAKDQAQEVLAELRGFLNNQKKEYAKKSGIQLSLTSWEPKVYTYGEFLQKVISGKSDLMKRLSELEKNYVLDETDETKLSMDMVKYVFEESQEFHENKPCIIVYFSPPYVPRIHVTNNSLVERHFIKAVNSAANAKETGILVKPFFPYISDMSWYGMADSREDIRYLKDNTPGFNRTCSVDLETITELNIPTVNIGPFGKDAHESTERLYMPYAFGTLPGLIQQTIKNLL
ncbi:MAG: M20/M25/M40 family metallo-hydrolase [Dehalobacterium sp.]